jgi:hypothetical protein
LIYIAYQQYNVSQKQTDLAERQTLLEYAKAAPQFMVKMEVFPTETSLGVPNKMPRLVSVRVERGEGVIQDIEIYQDIVTTRIMHNANGNVHANCQVRLKNYFKVSSDFSNADANSIVNRISIDPAFYYPNINGDFFIFEPKGTHVIISYKDVFGEDQRQVFTGLIGRLQKLPRNQLPKDSLYEIAEINFLSEGGEKFPALFNGRGVKVRSDGCKQILKSAVVRNL